MFFLVLSSYKPHFSGGLTWFSLPMCSLLSDTTASPGAGYGGSASPTGPRVHWDQSG